MKEDTVQHSAGSPLGSTIHVDLQRVLVGTVAHVTPISYYFLSSPLVKARAFLI